jgi:ribosomal-protein-alanine N-acetyltransferase
MKLEFRRLSEIDCSEYVSLNMNPLVRRQMPLTSDDFDEAACKEWIKGKERMWETHGYGPWAFVLDDKFAGWGGLQPEGDDADLGLVLHPDYWGYGKVIYEEIIRRAFGEMGMESVTVLFPPSRTRVKGILRLGFQPDGKVTIGGERFIRYRLYAPSAQGK